MAHLHTLFVQLVVTKSYPLPGIIWYIFDFRSTRTHPVWRWTIHLQNLSVGRNPVHLLAPPCLEHANHIKSAQSWVAYQILLYNIIYHRFSVYILGLFVGHGSISSSNVTRKLMFGLSKLFTVVENLSFVIFFSNSVRVFFDFNYPAIIIYPKISRRLYILYLYLYKKYLCHCKCNYMLVKGLNRFSKVEKGYASGSCWCVWTF